MCDLGKKSKQWFKGRITSIKCNYCTLYSFVLVLSCILILFFCIDYIKLSTIPYGYR